VRYCNLVRPRRGYLGRVTCQARGPDDVGAWFL